MTSVHGGEKRVLAELRSDPLSYEIRMKEMERTHQPRRDTCRLNGAKHCCGVLRPAKRQCHASQARGHPLSHTIVATLL